MTDRESIKKEFEGRNEEEYEWLIMIARLVLRCEEPPLHDHSPHREEKPDIKAR